MSITTRMYRPAGVRGARLLRRALLLSTGFVTMACADDPTSLSRLAVEPASAKVSSSVPGRVGDLKAVAASPTDVRLSWTEVDDGSGRPARYQIRYAPSPIGYGWGSATVVSSGACADPVKGTGIGNTMSCTVPGLQAGELYDFQLVAYRPGGRWRVYGSLSNVATAKAVVQATNPPKVADLTVSATTPSSATVSFTQVSDGAGGAASYEIRYAPTPIGWGWGSATTVTSGACAAPVPGTAPGESLSCTVEGLAAATSYDFQVVAFRETAAGRSYSPLSQPATGVTASEIVQQPTGDPARVTDLATGGATTSTVALSWTEVTDGVGGAASYEIRYAPTPIGWGWGSATTVTSGDCAAPLQGSGAGRTLSCTVSGLASDRSYDFQLVSFRQTDAGRVYADLSNVTTGKTGASTSNGDTGTGDGGGIDTGTAGSHEPAGFTPITSRPFNSANEDGWFSSGGLSSESDASAPVSGPGVLKATYPTGFGGGYAPIWSDKTISSLGYGKIYVSFAVKLSSNWQGHQTNTNKIGFVWLNEDPVVFFNAYGSGSGTLKPVISIQNTPQGGYNFQPNVNTGVVVKRGEWQRWEAVLIVNSGSNADGELHLWVDGVKVSEYRNVNLSSGGKVWNYLTWRPIWGGAGDSVRSTQYMWMDHYYASGAR